MVNDTTTSYVMEPKPVLLSCHGRRCCVDPTAEATVEPLEPGSVACVADGVPADALCGGGERCVMQGDGAIAHAGTLGRSLCLGAFDTIDPAAPLKAAACGNKTARFGWGVGEGSRLLSKHRPELCASVGVLALGQFPVWELCDTLTLSPLVTSHATVWTSSEAVPPNTLI